MKENCQSKELQTVSASFAQKMLTALCLSADNERASGPHSSAAKVQAQKVIEMSGTTDPYEFILSKLQRKSRCGKRVVTLCPAHDDKKFSLSVARGRNNNAVMKCHAGCSIEAICAGFSIAKSDLFSG